MAEFRVDVLSALADDWENVGHAWSANGGREARRLRDKTLGRAAAVREAIEAYIELQQEHEELQRLCVELSERLDAPAKSTKPAFASA